MDDCIFRPLSCDLFTGKGAWMRRLPEESLGLGRGSAKSEESVNHFATSVSQTGSILP
jgi:hypothetical protein